MREFRMPKGVTEHYTSMEALREGFGLKPIRKKTNDQTKLKAQQEKLVGTCRVCKKPLTFILGTNTCACTNSDCKGMKMSSRNEEDGTERVWYIPVTRVLNDKGMEIGNNLFSE